MTTITLSAEQIDYTLDDHAILSAVSCHISSGKILAVLGPNGAGKTTLLRVLLGLISPTSGRVLCAGKEMPPGPERAQKCLCAAKGAPSHAFIGLGHGVLGRFPHRREQLALSRNDKAAIEQASPNAIVRT